MSGERIRFGIIAGATALGAVALWKLLPEARKDAVKNAVGRLIQSCRLASHALRMYLDANRDGVIEPMPANYSNWQPGAGNSGAVIMVNTRNYLAGQPVLSRMEIQFRWDYEAPDPGAWQATLTVSHPPRVLIHETRLQGAPPVQAGGPINLHQAPFLALAAAGTGRLSLWIEAAEFPAAAHEADWRVLLTFQFTGSDGTVIHQQAELRIAPWLMASDLDPVRDVWFVAAAAPTLMQQQIQNFLPMGVAAQTRQPPAIGGGGYKPFMRDVMRCGWIMAPHHQDIVILEGLDAASVYNRIPDSIANAGRITNAISGVPRTSGEGQSSQDNGGNLLVTPPTAQHPFGRIVYGEQQPAFVCNAGPFFAAQDKQAPLVVDSTWLNVGHADEFISFVPDAGGGPWPYKILLASARLGYILAHAASAHPDPLDLAALITQADLTNAAARAAESNGANWATLQGQILNTFGPLIPAAGGPPAPLEVTSRTPLPRLIRTGRS